MKNLSFVLILGLLAACNDGGGGGSDLTTASSSSALKDGGGSVSNTTSDETDSAQISGSDQVESAQTNNLEDVVAELDEETLDKINDAFSSLDEVVELNSNIQLDTHYKIQKSKIFNIADEVFAYLYNYHASGVKIFKVNLDTQQVDQFELKEVHKLRVAFHNNRETFFISHKPVRVFKLNSEKKELELFINGFDDENLRLQRHSHVQNHLYLKSAENYAYINLQNKTKSEFKAHASAKQFFGDGTHFLYLKDGELFMQSETLVSSLLTQGEGEKLNLLKRGGQFFIRHRKKAENEKMRNFFFLLDKEELVAYKEQLPTVSNSHRHLKVNLNFSQTTKDQKDFKVVVNHKKTGEEFFSIDISDAVSVDNKYSKVFHVNDELFVASSSQNGLYHYSQDEFRDIFLPVNARINSMQFIDQKYVLGASGRYVLEFSDNEPAKVMKRMSQSFHNLFSYQNGLVFMRHLPKRGGSILFDLEERVMSRTEAGLRLQKVQNEEALFQRSIQKDVRAPASVHDFSGEKVMELGEIDRMNSLLKWDDGQYFFVRGRKIYSYTHDPKELNEVMTMSGMRVNQLLKTPNDKILMINDGKVQLLNPTSKDITTLYDLDSNLIHRVRSFTLYHNAVYVIDRESRLHRLSIPAHKLTLFDET